MKKPPAKVDQSTELTPDEMGQTVSLTPEQIQSAEQERAALLAALEPPAPRPEAPSPADVAEMFQPEAPITEDAAPLADVDAAIAERDRLQAEAERVKAELEESERNVAQAREQAAAHAQAVANRKAAEELAPMGKRVEAQKNWLQSLHNEYNPTLTLYAQSCASGTLAERSRLIDIYGAAAPLQQRLALAFKASTEALRLIAHAEKYRGELNWSVALKACQTALAHDPEQIRDACASLVERYSAVKAGINTVRIRLTDNGEAWRPSRRSSGTDSGVNTTWRQ